MSWRDHFVALGQKLGMANASHTPLARGWPTDADPRSPYPTLDEICETGAYYLPQDKRLVRRHVETVVFEDEVHGRRQLTVDLRLPREPEAAIAATPDGYRFYVPIALIRKDPPTTHLDLVDESGRSLPLLTRDQNAKLTAAALCRFAEKNVLNASLPPFLRRLIEDVVSLDDVKAYVPRDYVLTVARNDYGLDGADPRAATIFRSSLNDFSGNSLIWIGLSGRPGARRVVKLRYDIPVNLPPIRAQHQQEEQVAVRVHTSDGEHLRFVYRFVRPHPPDPHVGGAIRRLLKRVKASIAWSPIEIAIGTPYIRATESYHLQVEAPKSLEARPLQFSPVNPASSMSYSRMVTPSAAEPPTCT